MVADYACKYDAGYYASYSDYSLNLKQVLFNLKNQANKTRFGTYTTGVRSDRVYGLYNCRTDLSHDECHQCLEEASTTIIWRCPYHMEATVWYAECTLRYANRPLISHKEEDPSIWIHSELSYSNPVLPKVVEDMQDLAKKAAHDNSSDGYAEGQHSLSNLDTLYYLVQCTRDILGKQCEECLHSALKVMKGCCGTTSKAILVFFPSCHIRYDYEAVTTNHSSFITMVKESHVETPEKRTELSATPVLPATTMVVPIVASAIVILLLICVSFWFSKKRRKAAKFANKSLMIRGLSKVFAGINELNVPDSVQFKFEVLQAATDNFSESNDLGKGGFGSVYKGILSNGQEIAVKRLSTYSKQGFKEFKAEVLIVVKLQHKNLVRLLGFCLENGEQLLVYEFLPNSSLDRFLFDSERRALLDWETRCKIILGIARGLMYLHEDSRLTIVHRDLKCSNILLDEEMNPKIADFGLARLFSADQIHASTKIIVGTYGYMAPEYAMHGHFSIKSDVYSFGMMVLEIVSGQKSTFNNPSEQRKSLLHRAWKSWNSNQPLSLVDMSLSGNFYVEEAIKFIHIGLLCVQEEASRRPTMSRIVNVIIGNSTINLPEPAQPLLTQPIASQVVSSNTQPGNNVGSFSQYMSKVSGTEDISDLLPR